MGVIAGLESNLRACSSPRPPEIYNAKSKRGSKRRPANDQRLTTNDGLLRPLVPPRQILFLLRSQPVDLDPHRLQLQLGYALIEFFGNAVHRLLQLLVIADH